MQPAGTAVTNPAYFADLTAQINALDDSAACAEIQSVVNQAAAAIQAELASIRAQIEALLPVVTIPGANPGAIVGWIKSFVAPYVKAIATYEAQLASVLASVSALETAVANAAARLTSCTISIPAIT